MGITILLYDINNGEVSREADVILNRAFQYDSYRGPLKPGDPETRVYDIHRIFLHEFGHVLGLDHPDDHAQEVTAIMNSVISDLDSLATDDINGALYLYALRITSPGELDAQVGAPVSFQVTTNAVASYTATGLPAGLTLNSISGLITGTVGVTGSFNAQITAHAGKDVTAPLFVYVTSADAVGDLRQFWGFTVNRLVTDPVRNRIYASLNANNAVAIIDGVKLTILKTIPVASAPQGMAISADGHTLFVAESGDTNPEIGVIDLDSLLAKPSLPVPFATYDVATGMDDRLFVATVADGPPIVQVNGSTGEILAPFPSGLARGLLQVSPDRKTLYLVVSGVPSTLYSIDVSSDTPALIQTSDQIQRIAYDFTLSHDGKILCIANSPSTVLRIPTDDLNGADGSYGLPHGGLTVGPITFSHDAKTVLIANMSFSEIAQGIDIFDAESQVYQRTIQTDHFVPRSMTTDSLGHYVFVGSWETPELRVYTLDSSGLPAHRPQPKSLLNVSTRLYTEQGNESLIAGFIVTGDTPKNILVRGLGPSLPVENTLFDTLVTLYDEAGTSIASNSYWQENKSQVSLTGLAPADDNEGALYATLFPGSYTATMVDGLGFSGVGLVEVYDISADSGSTVANLSTRGNVGTGGNVMIGGFILSEDQPTNILVRAIGPSLAKAGVANPLQDPALELHGSNGDLIVSNDNWRDMQEAEIIATSIPPADDRESAILATLPPAAYTAIVRGKDDTTGVGLVEIYNLDSTSNSN